MASIEQLKILIILAHADGEVADKERQYIINIGQANHLLVAEILPLFNSKHPQQMPGNLSEDEKFDYIFKLVQLMKIDEKLYGEEIKYCAEIASTMGYRKEVLVELMLQVKNVPMEKGEMAILKKLISTYLQKN